MTGPTTAAELVDLAVGEVHELQHRAETRTAAATATELAAGWPAFSWSAHRLLTALHNTPTGGTPPPGPPTSTGTPDRNLQRAADYLGAAADLLDTRDRRSLTAQQRAYDADQITPHLVAAGYLIAATTAAHPALLDTAAAVHLAIRTWQPEPPTQLPATPAGWSLIDASRDDLQQAADHLGAAALLDTRDRPSVTANQHATDPVQNRPHLAADVQPVVDTTKAHPAPPAAAVTSLVDVSTLASAPSRTAGAAVVEREATSPALAAVHRTLHGWQQAALAVAHQPAPSSTDLMGAARTAGMLTRLAQNLLVAHADPTRTGAATASVSQQLRHAGGAWNAAADVWLNTATGGRTLSPDMREAGAALETAVRAFARTGPDWTSPQDLRAKASPDLARQLARIALSATQAVAEQHATLVARLGQTAALSIQARRLPVPQTTEEPAQRITDRVRRRFTRITPGEAAPLVDSYQRLPPAAAAARTAYTVLTDPAAALDPARTSAASSTELLPAAAQQPPGPFDERTAAVPGTLAGQRWRQVLADVDVRLLDDPHYPALAAALDRIQLAGADVPASLAAAASRPLPDEHAARALHWHLINVCPAALTPRTATTALSRPPTQPAALTAAAAVHRATPPTQTMRR